MKAGVLFNVNDIRYTDFSDPVCGESDVIVNVKACGICGSDPPRILKDWKYNLPAIPGHEFSGIIIEKGKNVDGFAIGDRVVVIPLIPCGRCENCKKGKYSLCENYDMIGSKSHGGFAEYVKVPSTNVLKIGDIDFEIAAMIEPLAVANHGVLGINPVIGDTVAIMGSGTLGQLVIQWLKLMGIRDIIAVDISDTKLNEAKNLGATICINAQRDDPVQKIKYLTSGRGVEIAFECAGSKITQEQCLQIAKKGGKVAYLGIAYSDIHLKQNSFEGIFRKELTLKGFWNSYSAPFPGIEWRNSIKYIENGDINLASMISHRFKLSQIKDAFDMIAAKKEEYNKIIIIP